MTKQKIDLPLVYSCSGCSNVAQLANDVAVRLDRGGHAQMSCIAGVGGHVKGLVKIAKSGRPILAIDGCKLDCVKNTLALHQVEPRWHLELTQLGLKKRDHQHCDDADQQTALTAALEMLDELDPTLIPTKPDALTPTKLVPTKLVPTKLVPDNQIPDKRQYSSPSGEN